jgi:subfamily B ATP-binding cassette protein MsbA
VKYLVRLWHYVGRYRLRLFAGIVFGVLSAALNLASLPTIKKVFEILFEGKGAESLRAYAESPWAGPLRWALTWVLQADRFHALVVIVIVLVFIKALQGLCEGLQEYLTAYAASRSSIDISNDLHGRVIDLPVGFFTQARSTQVASRFTNDMQNVERGLDTLFGKTIREPLYLAGFLFYSFWLAPRLTLVAMAVVPFIGMAIVLLARKAKRGGRRALESRARLLGILTGALLGIRIVKVFQGAGYEKERFRGENEGLFRQNLKVVQAEAATSPLVGFLSFIGVALVVIVSGHYIIGERLTTSQALTLFAVLGLTFAPLRKLANVGTRFQLTQVGAQRIFEYMDAEGEKIVLPGAADILPPGDSIRFEHVGFSYDRSEPVLTDIDFEVKQGEAVAIVGASGVGKTTLVNLIARFYDPVSGRILFDGRDIAEASLVSLRRQIGLVTQDVLLFDDTVRANIAYGREKPDEARVLEAARAAHVHEFVERMPRGYDTVIGEGGALLSGGQRQRLAIARAIYKDPAILILDEATSSLDSESEHLIKEALNRFMRGRTTFIIAHRLSTVERADRIIVLDRGRIEAMGKHGELVGASDVYRGLYRRQFTDDTVAGGSEGVRAGG